MKYQSAPVHVFRDGQGISAPRVSLSKFALRLHLRTIALLASLRTIHCLSRTDAAAWGPEGGPPAWDVGVEEPMLWDEPVKSVDAEADAGADEP